jgi:nitroreductase
VLTREKTLIDVMYERHSVRKYTPQKIDKGTLESIIKAAGSAPSAWNLQHWKFVVVQNEENKKRVAEAAFGQKQIVDAAAVVVVLGDTQANLNAERIYSEAVQAGSMTEEVKKTLVGNIQRAYESAPNIGVNAAIQNSSFAAMQLMLAAKAEGIDSCPIGGFDKNALCEVLSIPERYIPTLIITLGYAAEPAHASRRLPVDDILVYETF